MTGPGFFDGRQGSRVCLPHGRSNMRVREGGLTGEGATAAAVWGRRASEAGRRGIHPHWLPKSIYLVTRSGKANGGRVAQRLS